MGTDIGFALMLFTVLAPAGALAFVFMGIRLLFHTRGTDRAERLARYLIVPIAACMVGLIASATHLGTPGNALYVLTGWGRSPLSNEVVSAVAFLSLAWLYWLITFTKRVLPRPVGAVWLLAACAAAVWLVANIAVVYSIPTIPTWDSPFVPYALWAVALVSGSLLGVSGLALSRDETPKPYLWFLIAVAAAALVAGLAVMLMQNESLPSIENIFTTADSLVPYYGWCVSTYGLFAALGVGTVAWELRQKGSPRIPVVLAATVLVLVGAMIVRVPFYAMHMTIGV